MNAHFNDEIDTPEEVVTEYTLMGRAQLMSQPPLKWLVKGLLPATGLAVIFGASMSGKTFLALDAAMAIAQGVRWFGHRTKQAKVVYFPLEGSGTQSRLVAWEKANRKEMPDNFKVVDRKAFNLRESADVDGIIRAVRNFSEVGGVVIIDTLARATAGADENSSREMGEVIEAADRIATEIAGLVILVHHSGKSETAGMRGSSALIGAADAVIKVARSAAGARTWHADKVKDGEDGAIQHFKLNGVEIGRDEDGDPITSCSVSQCEAETVVATGMGTNQIVVLAAITKALETAALGVGYAPQGTKALSTAAATKIAGEALTAIGADKKRTTEALNGLVKRGALMSGGPYKPSPSRPVKLESTVWLPLVSSLGGLAD